MEKRLYNILLTTKSYYSFMGALVTLVAADREYLQCFQSFFQLTPTQESDEDLKLADIRKRFFTWVDIGEMKYNWFKALKRLTKDEWAIIPASPLDPHAFEAPDWDAAIEYAVVVLEIPYNSIIK